jgi:heme-degrading monooxygenase HmoA
MVMIVTMVAVAPGPEEEWEAAWRQLRAVPTAYPGFRRMTLLRDSTRPGHYVVQSEWESRFGFEQFLRISGVEWLNRGVELWTTAPTLVYDEVVDVVESEMSKEG